MNELLKYIFGFYAVWLVQSLWLQLFGSAWFDLYHFYIKDKHGIRWNFSTACTACSIAQLGRDGQCTFLTLAHAQKTLIPSFDYLAGTKCERERFATVVATVEFGAILQ